MSLFRLKILLPILLFATSLECTFAQSTNIKMLSKEEACADIDSLLYTLSEVHPNMFSVCAQGELIALFAKEFSSMPDSVSSTELYKRLAPVIAKIGDGHTSLYFPYNQYFTSETLRMPLYMKASVEHKLYVESCLDDKIPYGSEVVGINGINSGKMVEDMLAYACGEKEFYRIERVNNELIALFELLFKADNYDVTYIPVDGKKKQTVTLPAVNYDVLKSRMPRRHQSNSYVPYTFTIDKVKSVAVMDFRSFENPDQMTHFADSMFTVLKENNIKKLIIDVRENGGGNSQVGDILLGYISSCPYAQMGKTIIRVTPTTRNLAGSNEMPLGWYYYYVTEEELEEPLTKEQGHYDGKVYLLTSHHTFSSASSFAWAFKYFRMGTVIGEETGGMNVSYGDVLPYLLPNSRLQCGISFKRFWLYGADETNIHGTQPDISVPAEQAMQVALKK